MMLATSPLERPQKEQLKPPAFIFAIKGESPFRLALFAVRDHLVY